MTSAFCRRTRSQRIGPSRLSETSQRPSGLKLRTWLLADEVSAGSESSTGEGIHSSQAGWLFSKRVPSLRPVESKWRCHDGAGSAKRAWPVNVLNKRTPNRSVELANRRPSGLKAALALGSFGV